MHGQAPIVADQIEDDAGPVLVTIEYVRLPNQREPFLVALYRLSAQRLRDGAYAWGVFEDTAERGKIIETFLVESWLEYLRLHERVTKAGQAVEERVHSYSISEPQTTHLVTPAMV
ncbi:MAG: MFS transporter [Rhodocyclaceae bacterium]|nr:MFS transporter [Rhodocyclaceae bacterium]